MPKTACKTTITANLLPPDTEKESEGKCPKQKSNFIGTNFSANMDEDNQVFHDWLGQVCGERELIRAKSKCWTVIALEFYLYY